MRSLFILLFCISYQSVTAQNVGINKIDPEYTLDVRVNSIEEAAQLQISNLDKSRYIRFYSGSSLYPDPSITISPGRNLLFASYDDNTFSFNEYMRISYNGNVGIGTSTPDESAVLEVASNSQGFLPPRMTEAHREAITNPAAGLIVYCTNCSDYGEAQIYNGTMWTNMIGGAVAIAGIQNITNPITGKIWMDRNLGATQVAISSDDAASYGDMYQWGRGTDGHQIRSSGTTTTNGNSAVPNGGNPWDGLFITQANSPNDWLTPQDNTLWQGVNGTNNPCPSGYRLPTVSEWLAEIQSWTSPDAAGALSSPLKLPMAGYRNSQDGLMNDDGTSAYYWSSSVNGFGAQVLFFQNSSFTMTSFTRAFGLPVRCIKN